MDETVRRMARDAEVDSAVEQALSKSQRAYRWLRERIATHAFGPGYRLVLSAIAAELHMSVVPVREAIRQLEAEGLVTFERNVGAHVSMVDESAYRDSMQTGGILEAAATALAAPHLDADDIDSARRINDLMRETLTHFDPPAFTALNHRFHAILCGKCPNQHLVDLVDMEWGRLSQLRDSTFSFVPERARQSVVEHERILQLIETGASAPEIERAAREHREATLRAFLDHEHPAKTARETHDERVSEPEPAPAA